MRLESLTIDQILLVVEYAKNYFFQWHNETLTHPQAP